MLSIFTCYHENVLDILEPRAPHLLFSFLCPFRRRGEDGRIVLDKNHMMKLE